MSQMVDNSSPEPKVFLGSLFQSGPAKLVANRVFKKSRTSDLNVYELSKQAKLKFSFLNLVYA